MCVFPFRYQNRMYHECINEDNGSPWCPTEVNNHLGYVNGQWGICGQGCPGTLRGVSELYYRYFQ